MYQSMVEWTKRIDGAWKYDYTACDTYGYNDEAGASCQNIIAAPKLKVDNTVKRSKEEFVTSELIRNRHSNDTWIRRHIYTDERTFSE